MPMRLREHLKRLRLGAATLVVLAAVPGPAVEPARAATGSDLETLLGPAPDTGLRDRTGATVIPARLKDRLVVVSFVTTTCEITCVIRTRDLADTARSLPETLRSRVSFLVISLDPVRDDARTLRAFADDLGLDPAEVSVLGSDATSARHLRAALRYPADRAEPPGAVLVFDRIGQLAMSYGAAPLDRSRLARDLAELADFAQGVGHPPAPAAAPAL